MIAARLADDDEILAAELALGLIDGAELTAAQARIAADPLLSARTDWWRAQFADLAFDAGSPADSAGLPWPGNDLWHRIAARLPRNDNTPALMVRWRRIAFAAMASTGLLAAVLLWQVSQPSPAVPGPAPVMMASLDGDMGHAATVAYQPGSGRLSVAPTSFATKGRAAELWIIPASGIPQSLGVMDLSRPFAQSLNAELRRLVHDGGTLAITMEPPGGSPDGKPSGPPVAAGKIISS